MSKSTVKPGEAVDVAGRGFAPNQRLVANLLSDPLPLGTTRSDAAGNYKMKVTIPLAATPGSHRIVVSGPAPQGGEHVSAAAVTVEDLDCADFPFQEDAQAVLDANRSDPHRLDADNDAVACENLRRRGQTSGTGNTGGTLARTGSSAAGLTTGAVLAIGVGLLLVGLGRRRSRSTAR